jgi:anti-anti-sigma regulatory factor
MNVKQEYRVSDHLLLRIRENEFLLGYLIIELDGWIDAENADPCFEIIKAQGEPEKGIIFLCFFLTFTNTSGWYHFWKTIKDNIEQQKSTIIVGLTNAVQYRLSQSRLDLLSLCTTYPDIDHLVTSLASEGVRGAHFVPEDRSKSRGKEHGTLPR